MRKSLQPITAEFARLDRTIAELTTAVESRNKRIADLLNENAQLVEDMHDAEKQHGRLKAVFRDRMGMEAFVDAVNAARGMGNPKHTDTSKL